MKFISNLSIAVKIVAVSAVLAAVFLGISYGYALLSIRREFTDTVVKNLEVKTRIEAGRMIDSTNEAEKTVKALSGTPPIQGIIRARNSSDEFDELENSSLEQWKRRLAAIFTAEMNSSGIYDQLRYIDENGNELVRVNYISGYAQVVPEEGLQNKANRPYFIDAMKVEKGEVYVSDAELNREGANQDISLPYKPVIRYAVPIFDEVTGDKKGIVISNVLVTKIISVDDLLLVTPAQVYVVDSDGYYILNPDSQKEWGSPGDLATGDSLYVDFPQLKNVDLDKDSGFYEDDSNIFIYSRTHPVASHNLNWTVVKKVIKTDAYGRVDTIVFNSIFWGFGTYFVLFFVFLFTIRYLLSPLKLLTQASEKVGRGDFDSVVKVRSNDEIGKLSATFNNMVLRLKNYSSDLEKKVEERTSDLERANNLMEGRELKMAELKEEIEKLKNQNK